MARWYLDGVNADLSSDSVHQGSTQPKNQQEWAAPSQVAACDISDDKATEEEARKILSATPYVALFAENTSLNGNEICSSPMGLLETKPTSWDMISAALVYLAKHLPTTVSRVECRACLHADLWVLHCGSTVAEG